MRIRAKTAARIAIPLLHAVGCTLTQRARTVDGKRTLTLVDLSVFAVNSAPLCTKVYITQSVDVLTLYLVTQWLVLSPRPWVTTPATTPTYCKSISIHWSELYVFGTHPVVLSSFPLPQVTPDTTFPNVDEYRMCLYSLLMATAAEDDMVDDVDKQTAIPARMLTNVCQAVGLILTN